jgi:hypothetical protein
MKQWKACSKENCKIGANPMFRCISKGKPGKFTDRQVSKVIPSGVKYNCSWHEKGVILLYQLQRRKPMKFVSMQMFWKQSSVFNGTPVSEKQAKWTAKAAIKTQHKSWTKEQLKVDDERNVGTKLWKKKAYRLKTLLRKIFWAFLPRCLQQGNFHTGWS